MANIIEEFLIKREFAFAKTELFEGEYNLNYETYELSGNETLDGLKLKIVVTTVYSANGAPFAQDFEIRSNRGVVRRTSVNEVFEILRMFL